jgi:hypothetical protein
MQDTAFAASTRLWNWMVRHAGAIIGPAAVWHLCLLPVLGALAITACLPDRPHRKLVTGAFFGLTLVAFLLAMLPVLAKDALNPDEALFLACARKLTIDPVFYRSVAIGSSGPLNIYPLTLPAWFGAPITYVSARLTAALLMVGSICCLYIYCAARLGGRAARLVQLPVIGSMVLADDGDLLHYSSERMAVFLTCAALALLRHGAPWRLFFVGALTAAMCFCKLQAAPIALVVLLNGAAAAWRERPSGLAYLASGAALVPLAFVLFFLHVGVFEEFRQAYGVWNLMYSERIQAPLAAKLVAAADLFVTLPDLWGYHIGLGMSALAALALTRGQWPIVGFRKEPAAMVFPLLLLAVALYAVAKPGNPYVHYVLFLLVPWTLCIAVSFQWVQSSIPGSLQRRLVAGFVLCAFWLPSIARLAARLPRSYESYPQFDPAAWAPVRIARVYAAEGEPLVVWGWRSELYILTNMPPGTRFADSVAQIDQSPQTELFRRQYVGDFIASRPPVFLDAVGPGSFMYRNRRRWGHEIVADLARITESEYTLVADVDSTRVYVRNDRIRLKRSGETP